MADKKSPASGWPIIKGDYHQGSPESCDAVCTFGSHLDEEGICEAGAALCGSCKTENLGIEKLIANTVSNPNIRFLIFAGTEVKGHLSANSLLALHANGVEDGRIVNSNGAIPFIENLDDAAISRFMEQVEAINIMESEDVGVITAKIKECEGNDPGAFDADPIVVEVSDDEGAAEPTGEAEPLSGELALIHSRMKFIQGRVTDIGLYDRFAAGVYSGKVEGIMIGLIVSFALLGFMLMG